MLTKEELQALRAAEVVSFHVKRGQTVIQCSLKADNGGRIFTAREQRLFPSADGNERWREIAATSSVSGYRPMIATGDTVSAFYWVNAAQYNHRWRSVVQLLRIGDVLSLHWVAGNNNQYIDGAGLFADEITMVISRPTGDPLHLFLGYSVVADNSARMIRRES